MTFTGLMRADGASWSTAVRVPISPEIFKSAHEVLTEPLELIEHLPGGGKVSFRDIELAQHDAAADAPPAELPGGGAIGKNSKTKAFRDWLLKSYPDVLPPGVTDKHLVRAFEDETGVSIDVRTVGRVRRGT